MCGVRACVCVVCSHDYTLFICEAINTHGVWARTDVHIVASGLMQTHHCTRDTQTQANKRSSAHAQSNCGYDVPGVCPVVPNWEYWAGG